jgi:outer membrane lipoprotein-sorting protein
MKTLNKIALLALVGLLSACATLPQPSVPMTPTPQSPQPTEMPVPPAAADAAQTKLAGQLSISADQVTIVSYVAKDWPDGCLGAAIANEICTQMVTPGYQVVLSANQQQYTFRTNQDGSQVRPEPISTGPAAKDLPAAVQAARQALAKVLGVTSDALQVVSFEAVDWPDGCLGVAQKGMMCTDMVTPGYRVILGAANQQWEYHTDKTGVLVMMAKGPTQ